MAEHKKPLEDVSVVVDRGNIFAAHAVIMQQFAFTSIFPNLTRFSAQQLHLPATNSFGSTISSEPVRGSAAVCRLSLKMWECPSGVFGSTSTASVSARMSSWAAVETVPFLPTKQVSTDDLSPNMPTTSALDHAEGQLIWCVGVLTTECSCTSSADPEG